MRIRIIWFVLASFVTLPVFGGIEDLEIDGNVVTARIEFGLFVSADLTIEFEDATGLTEENLGLSAELVSPLDLGLLARLPAGALIPSTFPVLLHFNAPATGGLSFRGVATVELYTTNLLYTSGTTLRLFVAESGGDFEDVTASEDAGSFRADGLTPGWDRSAMVAYDSRSLLDVIDLKLDGLDGLLENLAEPIESGVYAELEDLLAEVRDLYEGDDTAAAITALDEFVQAVKDGSGDDVPDLWSAGGEETNAAGELRSAAAALRFSLLRASL